MIWRLLLPAALAGCAQPPVKGDCDPVEQGMFGACLSAGCSAEYSSSEMGEDTCQTDLGGSVVSVAVGGSCSFTVSGECFVVCDCPDGTGVTFGATPQSSPPLEEGEREGDCDDGQDNDGDGLIDCDDIGCAVGELCREKFWEGLREDTGSGDTGASSSGGDGDGDLDGDGFEAEADCDDTRAAVNPAASDIVGDGIDQNCDGVDGTDMDGDGEASTASGGSDCDDANSHVNSMFGIADIIDGIDSNCDGSDGLHPSYNALTIGGVSLVASGDFDGDGLRDVVGSSAYLGVTYVFLWADLAGRTFVDHTAATASISLLVPMFVGDFDGDGADDIAVNHAGVLYTLSGSTITNGGAIDLATDYDGCVTSSGHLDDTRVTEVLPDVTGDGVEDIYVGKRVLYADDLFGVCRDIATDVAGVYQPGIVLAISDLDMDADGYIEYLVSDLYAGTRYEDLNGGARGLAQTRAGSFIPDRSIGDVDGDGRNDVADGNCVNSVDDLWSDSCAITLWDTYENFYDIDGDGLLDANGRLDVLGANLDIGVSNVADDHVGDYNGDGRADLILDRSAEIVIVDVVN